MFLREKRGDVAAEYGPGEPGQARERTNCQSEEETKRGDSRREYEKEINISI